MSDFESHIDSRPKLSKLRVMSFWLLGIVAVLVVSIALQDTVGIPGETTLRIATAAICLFFIYKLGLDYPGERWPRISLWVALVVNAALFFTPLMDRPMSRGELMIFALPDAVIVMTARIVSYHVADVRQRANRQMMVLGLLVAIAGCIGILGPTWMQVRTAHGSSFAR